MNQAALDNYLRETLRFLRDSSNRYKGVVAACLVTNFGVAYAVAEKFPDGKSVHAERNALRNYFREYSRPPDDKSQIISTLSPCTCDSRYREGRPCIELLLGRDEEFPGLVIPNFHVGAIDSTQNIDVILKSGLNLTFAEDRELIEASLRLSRKFKPQFHGLPNGAFIQNALRDLC